MGRWDRPRRPLTKSIAGHVFDDIQRAVGFAVSLHPLRHRYGAGLISRGVSGVAVSHCLGHSSPEITYRVYAYLRAYLRPDDEAAGRAAMSQTMCKIISDAYPLCTLDAVQGGNRRSVGQSLAAVLFDMDGTLVETEQYWGEALAALAERLGGRLSARARDRTVGTSMRFALTVLYDDVGAVRTEEELRADARWVEERTRELMAAGAPWRPGARDLVAETLASGLPTALVTTTPRRLASVVLDQLAADLGRALFDVTVCGDEVPARKPDPAPYLQAAGALGVDVERSVVVEDSLAGVTSALAAGAAVLGVPSLQPLTPAPGLTLRRSLTGVGLDDLVALIADRDQDDPAA